MHCLAIKNIALVSVLKANSPFTFLDRIQENSGMPQWKRPYINNLIMLEEKAPTHTEMCNICLQMSKFCFILSI